jgi:hypothetical protein
MGSGTETFAQPASAAEIPTKITKPAMRPIMPLSSHRPSRVLGAGLARRPEG